MIGTESDVVTLQDIFAAGAASEGDGPASLLAPLEASGLKPHFARKMAISGVALPPGFFHVEEDNTFPSAFATRRNAWEES